MTISQTTSLKPDANQVSKIRIEVRALKYDGSERRRWPGQVLRQQGSLIVLDAKFPTEIVHKSLGTIAAGTASLEYYWLDRWYNVFRFAQPDGTLRNYYCNVSVPATFANNILSYVDLDLDILVQPDFSCQLLDEEDFQKNAGRYGYPVDVQAQARRAVDDLLGMIETRSFPFDN